MSHATRLLGGIVGCWLGIASAGIAQTTSVAGRVTGADGTPLAGVAVAIEALPLATYSDADGLWELSPVPAGRHRVGFRQGVHFAAAEVEVDEGATARLDRVLDWDTSFAGSPTVSSASHRAEPLLQAPIAISAVAPAARGSVAAAELPVSLGLLPGVAVTQSGLHLFDLNARGFNGSPNRRLRVRIDGREPVIPFFAAPDWTAITTPLDGFAEAELVRGPSAAISGANAMSGVLSLVTHRPRDREGGTVRLSAGELSTFHGEASWAAHLGGNWWGRLQGGTRRSDGFSRSRVSGVEYGMPCLVEGQSDCLPRERVGLERDRDTIDFGSARFDRYWHDGSITAIESGWSAVAGPVLSTGIGRIEVVDADRAFFRADHAMAKWNLRAFYNARKADRQTALATGVNLALDEKNWKGEIERWWAFGGERLQLIAGASYEDVKTDSRDPNGPYRPTRLLRRNQQTLLFEPQDESISATWAQLDWFPAEGVKLVLAGRTDHSSRLGSRLSPRAAAIFSLAPEHTLRLSYHEGFQVPAYAEYFLRADLADPINLGPLETLCFEQGVACGFNLDGDQATADTRLLAVGNENLDPGKVRTVELGYSGLLGKRALVTANYHFAKHEDFITGPLPQLGTALGRINPSFGPYQTPRCKGSDGIERPCLPANVDAEVYELLRIALGPRYGYLSNDLDGTPVLVLASYRNLGRVDAQGVELGLDWNFAKGWRLDLSGAWYDFRVKSRFADLDEFLQPNAPELSGAIALSYAGARFGFSAGYRWADDYRWVSGPFRGDVPAFGVLDLGASFEINRHLALGLSVTNATDERHWESFGGDLLARRVLGSVTFRW